MRLIGYLRTSTDEQESGLDAQRHAIKAYCVAHGYEVDFRAEQVSAANLEAAELSRALDDVRFDRFDGLIAAKLDRLTRSVVDLAELLERFKMLDKALIALDMGVDTSTPAGRLVANIMASVAQWEREAIGQRTKDALAAKRANGETISRPAVIDDPDTLAMIREWRQAGATLQTIADNLNKLGVPTLRGGKCWRPSALQAALS